MLKTTFVLLTLVTSYATGGKPAAPGGGAMSATTQAEAAINTAFAASPDGRNGAVPETVKRVTIPTLVMDGEKSMDFIHPTVDRIADFIPNTQRKTIAGQTHQAALEAVAPLLIECFDGRG